MPIEWADTSTSSRSTAWPWRSPHQRDARRAPDQADAADALAALQVGLGHRLPGQVDGGAQQRPDQLLEVAAVDLDVQVHRLAALLGQELLADVDLGVARQQDL